VARDEARAGARHLQGDSHDGRVQREERLDLVLASDLIRQSRQSAA
jgi:hypothetical protein